MKKLYTCSDCGAIITDPDAIAERTCSACLAKWFESAIENVAIAVIGVPTRALRGRGAEGFVSGFGDNEFFDSIEDALNRHMESQSVAMPPEYQRLCTEIAMTVSTHRMAPDDAELAAYETRLLDLYDRFYLRTFAKLTGATS